MQVKDKQGNLIILEDDVTLHKFANLYFNLKKMFQNEEIDKPYHESTMAEEFRERHGIELTDEEMLQLMDYYDNYYNDDVAAKIMEDYKQGAETINLKKLGLE